MNKHINITSKTYYSRGRVCTSYNQWNYYLSYNKYPIAVYFCYYSDSNSLIHKVRQQLIHMGGKGYAGPAGQRMYMNAGLSWIFLTKGNILTLFFPTWAVFTKFMQSEWGVKLNLKLPLITLSIQGNYLNLNYKLGIKNILQMGDNYLSYITHITQYLYTTVTAIIPNLSINMCNVIWIITYIIMCLAVIISTLTHSVILFQEYRSTLLITTSNTNE